MTIKTKTFFFFSMKTIKNLTNSPLVFFQVFRCNFSHYFFYIFVSVSPHNVACSVSQSVPLSLLPVGVVQVHSRCTQRWSSQALKDTSQQELQQHAKLSSTGAIIFETSPIYKLLLSEGKKDLQET